MTTTLLAYIPSPSQGVWYLGPFPVRAYALFIIVGIVVALVVGDRRWEARGGERGVIYDISLWAVPFGLIGGRVYHVITDWPKYFGPNAAPPVDLSFLGIHISIPAPLVIWEGGLGIWGAVALGGVGAWIACRNRGIPLPAFGDAIAPGIVLAQAIGRLGNYFNQELYGRPTTLPWGLEIYERRNGSGAVSPDLANGVSTGQLDSIVHPTFLYELLWNVLVFAVLIWIDRRFKIGHGRLFALYVAGYCLGRFWIELLRSDEATLIADIRVNSFTSTFVFIGAVVYIMVAPRGREDPSTLRGKPHGEKSAVEEVAEELVAVAATTGVVAAAKVAGDDDEDARAAEAESEPKAADAAAETANEDADADAEAEGETADAEAENEEPVEAEAEEETADAEAEDETPADEKPVEAEAEEETADAETEDETPADEEPAEAEAEEETADAEAEDETPADEEPAEAEAEEETADAEAEDGETDSEPSAEPVGGVGAVEGAEVVAAEEAAPEVHEAAVEAAAEAEEVAADLAAEPEDAETEDVESEDAKPIAEATPDSEPEDLETEDAEEAVGDAEEAAPSEDEDAEAVVDEAETAEVAEPESEDAELAVEEEAEPEPGALEAESSEATGQSDAAPPEEPAGESGGRLRRLLWGRRNG